jgi:hypothetical protein
MKIGSGFEVTLRLLPQSLRGYSVGIMKYTAKIGSDGMIHIPSFIKTGTGIQNLSGRYTNTDRHTHTQQIVLKSLF